MPCPVHPCHYRPERPASKLAPIKRRSLCARLTSSHYGGPVEGTPRWRYIWIGGEYRLDALSKISCTSKQPAYFLPIASLVLDAESSRSRSRDPIVMSGDLAWPTRPKAALRGSSKVGGTEMDMPGRCNAQSPRIVFFLIKSNDPQRSAYTRTRITHAHARARH